MTCCANLGINFVKRHFQVAILFALLVHFVYGFACLGKNNDVLLFFLC